MAKCGPSPRLNPSLLGFHAFLRTQLCPPILCPSIPRWLQPGYVTLRLCDAQNTRPHPRNAAGLGGRTPDHTAPCLAGGGTCSVGLSGASPQPLTRRPRSQSPEPLPAKFL